MNKLEEAIGGFSNPSKMPGFAWSIPAQGCITGAKLAKVKGSVCNKCYALKGRYAFPNVQNALKRREQIWNGTPRDQWPRMMADAIRHKYHRITDPADRVFRWFDSGDLRSVVMLEQIVEIANMLPDIRFWLPTREAGFVHTWHELGGLCPTNLTIRLSAPMVDGPAAKWWPTTSTVVSEKANATCPAPNQGNQCRDCRACWDHNVRNVAYKAH